MTDRAPPTVVDLIMANAARRGDAVALEDGDRRWTYAEFALALRRVAGWLTAQGFVPGDRLGLALRDSAAHVLLLCGAAHAGIVVVPIDWRAKPDERARLAADFALDAVAIDADRLREGGGQYLAIDRDWLDSLAGVAPADERPAARADRLFLVNLSSGTTAAARGALLDHGLVARRILHWIDTYGDPAGRRYLSATPLAFSAGRNYVLRLLSGGATIVLFPPLFSAAMLVKAVEDKAIDTLFLVPRALRIVLDAAPADGPPLLARITMLVCGADKLMSEEKRRIVARLTPHLYETYSTTATSIVASLRPADLPARADSVGRPLASQELAIVDEDGRPVAAGEVGRLRVRGPLVELPEEARAGPAARDGWYETGDLASLDADGYLYLRGRTANLISRNGLSLYAEEIEAVIRAYPRVADAGVVGLDAADGGADRVIAFVEAPGAVDVAALRDFCLERMTAYKVPDDFVAIRALPRTTAGKIRRGELREMAART